MYQVHDNTEGMYGPAEIINPPPKNYVHHIDKRSITAPKPDPDTAPYVANVIPTPEEIIFNFPSAITRLVTFYDIKLKLSYEQRDVIGKSIILIVGIFLNIETITKNLNDVIRCIIDFLLSLIS